MMEEIDAPEPGKIYFKDFKKLMKDM